MIEFDLKAFQQAVRTFIAGFVALFVSYYMGAEQSYWIVLSAVLLIQIRVGYCFFSQIYSELIAGALATILVFVASYFGNNLYCLIAILVLTSYVSVYVGFRKIRLFLPAYLVNLLAMISGGMPAGLSESVARSEFVLCGLVIAMVVTSLVCPGTIKNQINSAIKMCLNISSQLFRVIFTVYLDQDYTGKHFVYEKKIYHLSRLFSHYSMMLYQLHPSENENIIRINRIFEIIMGISSLRYRENDHYTFEIINQELKDLLAAFLSKFKSSATDNLIELRINRLEEVYRNVLQVAAKEPLMFLFFINGLRALNNELDKI